MVLSLAGEEGTTLSFPGHAYTDFQRRFQNRAESCQEAFLGCRQQVCCPQQVAFEHFQLWFTLPPGCFSPLVCPGSWLPGGQAVVGAEPFLPLDLEGLNVLDKQLGGRARLRRGG